MKIQTQGFLCLSIIIFTVIFVLFGLGQALVPLLIAAFMAYLLLPLVKKLEARGVQKKIAVGLALGLVLVFGTLLVLLFIPILLIEVKEFVTDLPRITDAAFYKAELIAARFGVDLPPDKEKLFVQAKTYLSELPVSTLKSAGSVAAKMLSGVVGVFLFILNLLLIPIFFFYLIADYERILRNARSLIPRRALFWFDDLLKRSDQIVGAYFRGQILVSLIIGMLYGLGLWGVGLRFGFVIGLLTGALNVIPYAGPLIGFSIASTVALAHFEGLHSILPVWLVFAVVQGLEGFVITPKIVGNRVGLNALHTMIALIVGANVAGFIGMLVAIPLAGIAKLILIDCKSLYQKSDLYAAQITIDGGSGQSK